MGIIETSAALGACLLVLTIAVVLDRRPYRPGKRNYIPVMIIALAPSLVLGRHLLSLLYMFAAGAPISERTPHRSERAQFGHSAPTSGV